MFSFQGLWLALAKPKSHPHPNGAQTLLLHNRLLGERLYLLSVVRFLVAACIAVAAFFGKYALAIDELPVVPLLCLSGALAVCNIAVFIIAKPFRDRERSAEACLLLAGIMHGTIMIDFMFLTVAIWLVGGSRSPCLAFYIFNVILSSVLLSKKAAWSHAALAYVLLCGLVLGEWSGWITPYWPAGAVVGGGEPDGRYVVTVLAVYAALLVLSAFMLTGLMDLLRAGERDIRVKNDELERLSNMRRDFLHIALHDLKSPLAAVSQHLFNLEARLSAATSDAEKRCFARCQLRIKEQLDFLRDLQTLATIESNGFREKMKVIDIEKLLREVAAEYEDVAQLRSHAMTVQPPQPPSQVNGIERLLREAVANLVTNAVKYTPEGGTITLRATPADSGIRIEVEDTGIGISPSDQQRLFKELVRIRPKGPGIDESTSSGLGLSIVRRIVEYHGGCVGVQSQPGKGSTFWMLLPADAPAPPPKSPSER